MSIASELLDIKNAITAAAPTTGPSAYNPPVPWSSGATYTLGPPADIVTIAGAGGGLYVAVATSTNFSPTSDDGTHWLLMASNGANGATGPAGPQGQGFNLRGAWAPTTAYVALDVVLVGSAPNQVTYICIVPHTSAGSFVAGSNWAPGTSQGPAGMSVMVWNGSAYVKASDSTTGRPSSGSYPGGTVFYIGPNQPSDAVTNDPWLNYALT